MNFSEYIGLNNPQGVNSVLIKNGYEPCDYTEDCPNAIELLIREKGVNATEELLQIHPDYDIIVALDQKNNPPAQAQTVKSSVSSPVVSSVIPPVAISESLKEVLIIIMAFWLLNKIISS